MTFSRMTLGEPMLKAARPPRDTEPCVDPYLTGANILPDPGFEQQLATFGGGPVSGFEIPQVGSPNQRDLTWGDLSAAPHGSPWACDYFSGVDADANDHVRWKVVTTSPDTGTYHLRHITDWLLWNNAGQVYCVQVDPCDEAFTQKMTAVVNPGDFVQISVRAKADATTFDPYVEGFIQFYTAAQSVISTTYGALLSLTTSYATWTHPGVFAPTNSAFVLCGFYDDQATPLDSSPDAVTVDVDNVVVSIS